MMTKPEILEILQASRYLDTEENIESFSGAVLSLYEFSHDELDLPFLHDLLCIFTDDCDFHYRMEELLDFVTNQDKQQVIPVLLMVSEKIYTEAQNWLWTLYSYYLSEADNWQLFKSNYSKLTDSGKEAVNSLFEYVLENAKTQANYPEEWHNYQIQNVKRIIAP